MYTEGIQIEVAYTRADGITDGFVLTLHASAGGVQDDSTYTFTANPTSLSAPVEGMSGTLNIVSKKVTSNGVTTARGVNYTYPS